MSTLRSNPALIANRLNTCCQNLALLSTTLLTTWILPLTLSQVYLQLGEDARSSPATLELLAHCLEQPCFHQLRFVEQVTSRDLP